MNEWPTFALIGSYLLTAIISCFLYQWYLDTYRIYSDRTLRLVKQLILGAGACYLDDIRPEMGLVQIQAAEALMARKQIIKHCECDYRPMIEVLEQRANKRPLNPNIGRS